MPSKTAAKQRTRPTRRAAPAKKTASTSESKTQARSQDSAKSEFRAEGIETPVPEDLAALESEREDLHKQGRVSKADTEQIDNSPGYNRDQLSHMREYWGLDPSDSAVQAEQGQLVEEVV